MHEQALLEQAAKIRLAVFDVDGVLTDGRLYYGPEGEALKVFHSRDGLALKALARSGIQVAIISGRQHAGVNVRMQQLGIDEVHQGIEQKLPVLEGIMQRAGVTAEETCFTGDDWNDAPVMRATGLAFAPCDAAGPLHHLAHYVTRHGGGLGAVREICELLLCAHQKLYILETIGLDDGSN
ncbi:MAG: HAD-IIIA family hydrolase [Xanthomonadales bacterium]|jgi:3-deoxy-D-manno-octulosonate 8-phosphate phosphatase (KDO 8-P phosphatase)|nr:HAD-IIIA family hydrolase [Xanthomonadales bacterium]